ncbi:hypothetical protein [Micromonospora sp. NPDC005652]|uniref:hypothetical protein n=1 Tax=Micromonospora sp. NPDC005652 TaxID=3157046 RepID=UPI0033F0C05B
MTDMRIRPERADYELIVGEMVAVEQPSLVGDDLGKEVAETIADSAGALEAIIDEIWAARQQTTDAPGQITDEAFGAALRAAVEKLRAEGDEFPTGEELDANIAEALQDESAKALAQAAWKRAGEKLSQA